MHRHLFREKNTPEKNHSGVKIWVFHKKINFFSPFGRKVSQDYMSKITQHNL
jgi:hypothetical protein